MKLNILNKFNNLVPRLKKNFLFDSSAGLFVGLLIGSINTFILVQARRLGATDLEVGYLAAIAFICLMLSPLWARLFGKLNPFKVVCFADSIARLSLLLLLINNSVQWYIIVFTIYYFFSSISATAYGKAMEYAYPSHKLGLFTGIIRIGISLTSMISAILAGIFLPVLGPQKYFAALVIFGLGSSVSFYFLKQLNAIPPIHDEKISYFNILINDKKFRNFMIALFIFGLANLLSVPSYAMYMVDEMHLSDSFIAFLYIITSITSVIFYYIGGRIIDKRNPINLFLLVLVSSLFLPILYLLIKNPYLLVFCAIFQGIINSGIDLSSINNIVYFGGNKNVSAYNGIHLNLMGLRGAIAPFFYPILKNTVSIKGIFWIIFTFSLISVLYGIYNLKIRKLIN